MQRQAKVNNASWSAANEDSLVRFSIEGDVDPLTGGQLLGACSAYMGEVGATGLVGDYSRARVLLTVEQLTANLRRSAATSRVITAPTALVVRRDDAAQFLAYARALAQIGVVRAVFNDYESARRWAAIQAQIHASEMRRGTPRAE